MMKGDKADLISEVWEMRSSVSPGRRSEEKHFSMERPRLSANIEALFVCLTSMQSELDSLRIA